MSRLTPLPPAAASFVVLPHRKVAPLYRPCRSGATPRTIARAARPAPQLGEPHIRADLLQSATALSPNQRQSHSRGQSDSALKVLPGFPAQRTKQAPHGEVWPRRETKPPGHPPVQLRECPRTRICRMLYAAVCVSNWTLVYAALLHQRYGAHDMAFFQGPVSNAGSCALIH